MDCKQIQRAVEVLFHNHIYQLFNSYIYDWECDYYSRSKSGYDYEVEIKVSRSDFFADFKKEKHKLFGAILQKKTHVILPSFGSHGDTIAEVQYAELKRFNKITSNWVDGKWSNWLTPGEIEQQEHADMLNNYRDYYLQRKTASVMLPATRIYIKPVANLSVPNVFYYAVPEGLIRVDEVPDYAGLIYIDKNHSENAFIVKKAPFIHKRDCEINRILLNKFYYETMKHRSNNAKTKQS